MSTDVPEDIIFLFRVKEQSASCLLNTYFLFGLLFNPEYGGDMFLRNVG
jgi:hypothetical protein